MKLEFYNTNVLNINKDYSFNNFKKIDLILADKILSVIKKEIKIKHIKKYLIVSLKDIRGISQFWIETKELI